MKDCRRNEQSSEQRCEFLLTVMILRWTSQPIRVFILKPIMLEQNQLCFPSLCGADATVSPRFPSTSAYYPLRVSSLAKCHYFMTVIKNRFRSIVDAYSISHHHNELFNLYLLSSILRLKDWTYCTEHTLLRFYQ